MKTSSLPFVAYASAAFLIAAGTSFGRNEWLTAKTVGGKTVPLSAEALTQPLPAIDSVPMNGPIASIFAGTPTSATLDLTMSIADDPAGDNDGNHQGQSGSADQDKWERIVQHYADAIFEMTEGVHKIRKVRIFKKGKFASNADIVWTSSKKGRPNVQIGVGEPGGRVNMFNIFQDGEGTGKDHDMLADEKGSGYTMAHEYGHYFYGLFDEYPGAYKTDKLVTPSVMADHWSGRFDLKFLNFSIKYNGGGLYQDTLLNDQHRQHGSSAWETLVRHPSRDAHRTQLGRRVYYPELAAVAPTGTNTPVINLPNAAARSELDIIWVEKVLFEVVIDNSGSMSGYPLSNAKTAAKLLVDRTVLGESRIGLIKFDSTASVVMNVTDVNTQQDRNNLKSAIDGINVAGNTAIGDAAVLALNQVKSNATVHDTGVVFLLSDGESNTGSNPLSAIPAYQTAQVPLFTFAFGTGADSATLRTMAEQTGGKFYVSPTSLADITLAFQDAFSSAISQTNLTDGQVIVPAKKTMSSLITVDTGLTNLSMNVVLTTDKSAADLYTPRGVLVPPVSTNISGSETVLTFSVAAPVIGNWKLVSRSLATYGDTTVKYHMGATPGPGALTLSAYALEGTAVRFPAPVLVRAKLDGSRSVVGAYVTATASSPSNAASTFSLHDDGKAPDERANDGLYSGYYYYTQNGTYDFTVQMDNRQNKAKFTSSGSAFSPPVQGGALRTEPDAAVGRAFMRSARFSVITSNGVFASSLKQLPKGAYAGLLGAGDDHDHTGFLNMVLSANGVYSGKLWYGGVAYSLKGSLNANGAHARTIIRRGLEPLHLNLRVDALNGSDLMTGELMDGGLTIPISLTRTYYSTAKPTPVLAPDAGRYTWALLPALNGDAAVVPPGIGFSTFTISTVGIANVAGKLADGTAFSSATQITKDHSLPIYASLYSAKGSLFGTLPISASEFEGAVRWIKPARSTDKLYPTGFSTLTRTMGTIYTPPAARTKALDLTSGAVNLVNGGLAAELQSSFTFDALNRFVFTLPNSTVTKLGLTTSTGALSGEFRDPVSKKVVKLYGVVLQNRKAGGGYFLGATQGGAFEFGALGAPAMVYNYSATGLPIAIPDRNSTGITSNLAVAGQPGTVVKAKLSLHIAHTYRGDLKVTLISPNGTSVVVHNQVGGSTDNVDLLNLEIPAVVGSSPNGTWQLNVADLLSGDIGSLESWSLELSSR